MKVASMVRGYIPIPRPADIVYMPIDLAMAIGEGLILKGHQFDFYGPRGTKPPIPLKSLGLKPLINTRNDFERILHDTDQLSHYVPGQWDYYYAREMFEKARQGKYDLLHFHHPEVALPFASLYPEVPVVYTLHDIIYDWYKKIFEMHKSPNQFFITISNSQRKPAPRLNYIGTVYNGIHLKDFPFSEKADDYLLFSGRIVPVKGAAEAVKVALKTGQKLKIIGPVFPDSQAYFDKQIKPYLNNKITYIGYVDRDKLSPYYQKAKAFLMPINWEESFGVAMIEALACGTPVIATRRGSVPEVIVNGKTGFIVDTLAEMAKAVKNIDQIDRATCRHHVEENFSIQKMVDGYETAFKAAIKAMK